MIVDTLLLLNSAVAMAMAIALLPAVWPGTDRNTRYWAWGCVAIGWSWLARGWGAGLPLDSTAMLSDGLRILGITLFAQASRADDSRRLNPLWPIGLLVAGYLVAALVPSVWPARGLFVAILVAWIAWRTGFPLLHELPARRRPLGLGFLLFGLLAVNVAGYRFFSGNMIRLEEQAELVIAMLKLMAVVFLTTSYLIARGFQANMTPLPCLRDGLTGCLDRGTIDRRLEREFARTGSPAEPLTVLMIDLDHLKTINDTHGHRAGDDALCAVAAALTRQLRASDTVGRYGGDEFLAILPGTTAAQASQVVERVRTALAKFKVEQEPVTVSIGIAERHPRDRPETLVSRADVALYTAKHQGRDQAAMIENNPSVPREGERGRTAASPPENPNAS